MPKIKQPKIRGLLVVHDENGVGAQLRFETDNDWECLDLSHASKMPAFDIGEPSELFLDYPDRGKICRWAAIGWEIPESE